LPTMPQDKSKPIDGEGAERRGRTNRKLAEIAAEGPRETMYKPRGDWTQKLAIAASRERTNDNRAIQKKAPKR